MICLNSDKLNARQAICLLTIFLIGDLSVSYGAPRSGGFALLSFIAAALGGAIPAALFSYILNFRRGGSLYDTVKICCPLPVFYAFSVVFMLFALICGCFSLNIFTTMINATALPDTPPLLLAVFVCIIAAIMIKSGLSVAGKCAFAFFLFIVSALILSGLLSLPSFEIENLADDFNLGNAAGDALYYFCGTFCKTVLFLGVISHFSGGAKKVIFSGTAAAAVIVVLSMLRDMMTLGSNVCALVKYPPYYALSAVSAFDFLQRIEVLSTVSMLFCCICSLAVTVYCVCIGISRITGLSCAKNIALPCSLLFAGISCAVRISDIESTYYIFSVFFAAFSLISAIFIAIAVRKKRKSPDKKLSGKKY